VKVFEGSEERKFKIIIMETEELTKDIKIFKENKSSQEFEIRVV